LCFQIRISVILVCVQRSTTNNRHHVCSVRHFLFSRSCSTRQLYHSSVGADLRYIPTKSIIELQSKRASIPISCINSLPLSMGDNTLTKAVEALWHDGVNAPDSWIPFFVPLFGWFFAWCCAPRWSGIPFHQWLAIHSIHHWVALLLASISLYFNDDTVFNERMGILFSLSYFVVEALDSIYNRNGAYTLHALLCLILGVSNYRMPILRELRMNRLS
jgi:hypothetical protein